MRNRKVAYMSDQIEKVVDLKAPLARVWKAISDHREFGTWFRVALDQPFVAGEASTGKMTYPGHEGAPWAARVVAVEPERLLSFRWENDIKDMDEKPTTLVIFALEAAGTGTRVTITESGFENLPAANRLDILRGNTEGWAIQANNLAAHVGG
ncbi:MAG: SRPBCC family protein [Deltaproteobacteria bacterium]